MTIKRCVVCEKEFEAVGLGSGSTNTCSKKCRKDRRAELAMKRRAANPEKHNEISRRHYDKNRRNPGKVTNCVVCNKQFFKTRSALTCSREHSLELKKRSDRRYQSEPRVKNKKNENERKRYSDPTLREHKKEYNRTRRLRILGDCVLRIAESNRVNEYLRNRRKSDPQYRDKCTARSRVYSKKRTFALQLLRERLGTLPTL